MTKDFWHYRYLVQYKPSIVGGVGGEIAWHDMAKFRFIDDCQRFLEGLDSSNRRLQDVCLARESDWSAIVTSRAGDFSKEIIISDVYYKGFDGHVDIRIVDTGEGLDIR